jgi:hypothetical protein
MNFVSASITPQSVNTGDYFVLSVKIEEGTYERLKRYIHGFLARFTHKQLSNDLLEGR